MNSGLLQRRIVSLTFLAPLLWILCFMLLPYGIILVYSFWQQKFPSFVPDFQFGNYVKLFAEPQFFSVILRSMTIATTVSVVALCLAFPFAYYLVFKVRSARLRMALYIAVIAPLWVSYLLRAYTWKTILGSEGILNSALVWSGILPEPTDIFLYNRFAMVVTMTYIFIPFMVMPIYTALEKIPRNLIEASADLGVRPFATFTRVIWPLAIPGVVAGATFTFCLSLGDFIAPILVGGADGMMIANLITSQFGTALNWPLGSALSMLLLFIVLIIIELSNRAAPTDRVTLG
uniref:RC215 n=1 Tax=Ruegeria sp. PR1b TaxID=185588 RepID=Q8KVX5_9RHOB|nr:ABC transporter permease [Ruegeria sp. PR1b]AAN05288.1 RC215 [Ruegeria sp. PR1b]